MAPELWRALVLRSAALTLVQLVEVLTFFGVLRAVNVPSPSCPYPLKPQQYSPCVALIAQVCEAPAETDNHFGVPASAGRRSPATWPRR
ncbi:MAG: hypothetical protein JWR83_642 [Aeromicrobium sp.]|nr:hypothetical protein [Aeromicrobium sp.]